MITSKWLFGQNCNEVLAVRSSVKDCIDSFDEKSMHLVIFNDDIPVGTGSLYFDKGAYNIAHMAVVPHMQRQYIGDLMIRMLLLRGFNMMAEKIQIKATSDTKEFFEKYGFRIIDEELFLMEVTPQTLVMNSKCGHDCSECINKDSCQR